MPNDINVLVVDDDSVVRELFTFLLGMAGFQVHSAECAEEALEYLQRATFDVVITDASFPGMSGLDLVSAAHKNYKADIMVVTGDGSEELREEAMRKGASDFILKPVLPDELVLRLRRVLEKRNLRQAYAQKIQELHETSISDNVAGFHN